MKRIIPLAALTAIFAVTGCSRQTETTIMQYMPHMANTPILKAQRGYTGMEGTGNVGMTPGTSMMMPPENSIARGHKPYRFTTPEAADAALKNPLPLNKFTLEQGQKIFNTYCIACHGPRGMGDGPIVNPYPIPKSLHSENMLRWGDGHIFHVITMGQGVMPSYAQQIQPEDRWAAIHYVRALQRAQNRTDEDVRELKKLQKE